MVRTSGMDLARVSRRCYFGWHNACGRPKRCPCLCHPLRLDGRRWREITAYFKGDDLPAGPARARVGHSEPD